MKKPTTFVVGFSYKELGGDLLSHARSKLSLAQIRFTALFGMGRGGSKSLWPPSITVVLMLLRISRYAVLRALPFIAAVPSFNKLEEVKFGV